MKKFGLYLLTSTILCSNCMIGDAYASSLKKLFKKSKKSKTENSQTKSEPKVTISTKKDNNNKKEVSQAKVEAKKSNILQKIQEIKQSSKQTDKINSPVSITFLGDKPVNLYTYDRLLEFQPHPTTEFILKDKPVLYNDKNYYFSVTYNEDWKEISENKALLKNISFTINVFENGKIVRKVTTPNVVTNNSLKVGQTIGIADISPFKFVIKTKEISSTAKGANYLVFKLDLIG